MKSLYALPIPTDTPREESTIRDLSSKHAIDFLVPVGTKVKAVREVFVNSIRDLFGGNESDQDSGLRFVIVYHGGGKFSTYVPLAEDGLRVKEGQYVKQGELMGYTGVVDIPHLHFGLIRVDHEPLKAVSLPFRL